MPVAVKVCGLTCAKDVETANEFGASYIGFNFYPPSPRALSPEMASSLVALVSGGIQTVGIFVDPSDSLLDQVLAHANVNILQLHGSETPARVEQIRKRTEKHVMKALQVATSQDVDRHLDFLEVSDLLLFDAKPPGNGGALPGGNGLNFDWRILRDRGIAKPWLLAGGLTIANLASAIECTGATAVDVSSGIEQSPGVKDPARMQQFLESAASLNG